MAYNGAGAFSLVAGNPVVTGTTITSTWANNTLTDIVNNGLSNCVVKDGQQTITGAIPMAGFRITGLGAATTNNDAVRAAQLQLDNICWSVAAGTADAITASYIPVNAALVDGMLLGFRASGANTLTNPTFSPDGLTARTITKIGGTALLVGDIVGNLTEVLVRYNLANTRWELLNPGLVVTPGSTTTLTNKTLTNPANTTQALTDAATISWDASLGGVATVTVAGNRTMAAPTNLKTGGHYVLHVTQDGTGGRTLTWNAVFKGHGGQAMASVQPIPTLSTTSSFTFESPDGTNLNLIWSRIGITQVFTGTATYTPTAGMRWCKAWGVGSGGAGGGAVNTAANGSAGTGGNGGAYAQATLTAAQIGASQAVTINAAGTGVSGANGNAGGTVTLGSLLSAKGGEGGVVGGDGGTVQAAATSQSATGDVKGWTRQGGGSFIDVSAQMISGKGGETQFGGAGRERGFSIGGGLGDSAVGYGSGGGGGTSAAAGGSQTGGGGAAGILVIEENF